MGTFTKYAVVSVLAFAAVSGAVIGYRFVSEPETVLLVDDGPAHWIVHDYVPILNIHEPGLSTVHFRTTLEIQQPPSVAVLQFTALRNGQVHVNNTPVVSAPSNPDNWKTPRTTDLAPYLTPGANVLRITVTNDVGPAALRARGDELGLFTGNDWRSSADGKAWFPARRADQLRPAPISRTFSPSYHYFILTLPWTLPVFVLIACARWEWTCSGGTPAWLVRITPSPGALRWILIAAFLLLGANNLPRLQEFLGFDIGGHMEYFAFLIEHKRLPIATEGWELYQAPLYYLASVIPYAIFTQFLTDVETTKAMRFISILCGAAQIEIAYRVMRTIYPNRAGLQSLGVLAAGLLPMNIYASQYVSNEPFTALLGALVILFTLKLLRTTAYPPIYLPVFLGVCLGLALISKVSTIILVPPVLCVLAYVYGTRPKPMRARLRDPAIVVALTLAISAWFYIRSYLTVGELFPIGWDPERGVAWWQDPGYRTPEYFLRFGEALFYPGYAAMAGFWDAVYSTLWTDGFFSGEISIFHRPPWNDAFLFGAVWYALIPSIAFLAGVAYVISFPIETWRRGHTFCLLCLTGYFIGLAYVALKLPFYSVVKANYTLALLPCYALLIVLGVEILGRNRFVDALLWGGLASWAANAYLAFFIV